MRFSIVMPVYNGERFAAEAVESVLAQSVEDWELIAVNDGSRDRTQEVLEKYASDPRITVIAQPNGGVSAARNRAIREAKGEYVAFIDADDRWYPNHLQTLQEMAERYPDAGLICTTTENLLQNGERTDTRAFFAGKPEVLYLEDFFAAYAEDKRAKCYNMVSTCMRRDAIERFGGFRVGCKIGEDLALSLQISAYYPVVLCGRNTALYDKTNSTATKDVSFDPDWFFFEASQPMLADPAIPAQKRENIRHVMNWFQMRRCRHYLVSGKKAEARAAYRAIGNDPALKKDQLINGALLLLPCSVVKQIFLLRWRTQA